MPQVPESTLDPSSITAIWTELDPQPQHLWSGPVSPGGRGREVSAWRKWEVREQLQADSGTCGTCAGLTLFHVCVSLPKADPSSHSLWERSVAQPHPVGSRVCPSHFSTALRKP